MKKNTITREHLARAIKRETGLPINRSLELVDQVFTSMSSSLVDGEDVKIRLFGSFSTKRKNARVGRNPKNLKEALIPERTVVKFKVAPTLKKRINTNIHLINNAS
ncbi:MAG: HU family DNA-binding protein [Alphaproteobacteria bacterium]|jgi:nucleoid DNA-binding protein|nr:HU family DNA-binding protein [Candidatus Jidaibacter sp.]